MGRDKIEFVALSVSNIFYDEIKRNPDKETELIRNRVGFECVSQKQLKACEVTPSFTSCDYTSVNSLEDLPVEPKPVFRQRIPVVYKDIHFDCVRSCLHSTCRAFRESSRCDLQQDSERREAARRFRLLRA